LRSGAPLASLRVLRGKRGIWDQGFELEGGQCLGLEILSSEGGGTQDYERRGKREDEGKRQEAKSNEPFDPICHAVA
jgi:hypothetical protein